jgi:phage tail-like protein
MDSNNTPYFIIKGSEAFTNLSSRFVWDARCDALTLAQDQALRLPQTTPAEALSAWELARPLIVDRFGQIGRISPSGTLIEYNAGRGYHTLEDGELNDVAAPQGQFTDLSLGGDGRLVACYSDGANEHGLLVFHLRRRWQSCVKLEAQPLRAIVDGDNRVWCVSDTHLYLYQGEPLFQPYHPKPERFEPTAINPHELSLQWQQALPDGLRPLAMCQDEAWLYLLTYDAEHKQQIITRARNEVDNRPWRVHALDEASPFIVDLTIEDDSNHLIGLSPRESGDLKFTRCDCPPFILQWDPKAATGEARLVYERYPMLSQQQPRFVSSLDRQVRYQSDADPANPEYRPRPRELHALPHPQYVNKPSYVTLLRTLDAGRPDTTWHRIYIEGRIPKGCTLKIYAKVFNDPAEAGQQKYHPQPLPLWTPLESELAFHPGLVPSKVGESGLFELLLQRSSGNVRRLQGRYLKLRILMQSGGRDTPAIHAMRVYYPRFSYQEHYLPEYLRQEAPVLDAPANTPVPANGADVRERFLAAFEGVLTPLEGKLALAEALIHPKSTPAQNLPWLAEMLGRRLPDYWPEQRRREMVQYSGQLQKARGTWEGIRLALEVASGGMVSQGEIVVVENFRLRRTMATILGINMDDRDHPLTLGTGISGNSIVGDSLILSEEDARSFLAHFAPEVATEDESEQVQAFFDRYSHQVSVLLHGRARGARKLVEEVLDEEMPAHIQWRIIETDHPFVLGLSPLLAVDSYLEESIPPRRVSLNDTYLGREGVLENPQALSPRDVNARPSTP